MDDFFKEHKMTNEIKITEEKPVDFTERLKEMNPDIKLIYSQIIKILKKYCDLREDHYSLIALWVIGTFIHNSFPSYPYLYFNAMRGSGKSRLMKLIATICFKGKVCINMSESVLFRTAALRTLCIDEFESASSKEKASLMELLNAAYKKGNFVERAIKRKGVDGEKWDIESYNVYCPICIANISGMENVLSDRCITLILEKSALKRITRMIEDYDNDPDILELKRLYEHFSVVCVVSLRLKHVYQHWNNYISEFNKTTLTTHTTYTTYTTQTTPDEYFKERDLFEKIEKTGLDGRHLELFFPLFILADECDILDEIIATAERVVLEKKDEDISENRDIALLIMFSQMTETNEFMSVKSIADRFNKEEDTNINDQINSKYIGRALKRLNLISEKRRVGTGREVKINWKKVAEKARMFRIEVQEKPEEIKIEN